jgi:hypothetical protein
MKKILALLTMLVIVAVVTGCKEKRCACTTIRGNYEYTSHSLEPLGSHSSCSDLNAEWTSTIDGVTLLSKECVPEE